MKVIYKKTLLEKIHNIVIHAKNNNKEIDFIELSGEEFRELEYHSGFDFVHGYYGNSNDGTVRHEGFVNGVRFMVV